MAALPAMVAEDYKIVCYTTHSSGYTSSGGDFTMTGTVGQFEAGDLSGGEFRLSGGYWAFPVVLPSPGVPLLTVVAIAPGQAAISWSPGQARWVFQDTFSLEAPVCVNVPGSDTTPVPVATSFQAKFYRLHQP